MKDRPPSLLIGERDPFMRRALEKALKPHYTLTFADNGIQVLNLARTSRPKAIILEVLLPVQDGFQVCKRLKEDPQTRQIPVLFFTLLQASDRAFQAGADEFLLKPIRENLLLKTIQFLLTKSSAEQDDFNVSE